MTAGSTAFSLTGVERVTLDGVAGGPIALGTLALASRLTLPAGKNLSVRVSSLSLAGGTLDLNDNAGFAGFHAPAGGVRGGRQNIWTVGLNWYPNNAIRFLLDYQHTNVSRLNTAGADIGAKLDTVALRVQLSL